MMVRGDESLTQRGVKPIKFRVVGVKLQDRSGCDCIAQLEELGSMGMGLLTYRME